jgi:hypothetical protein
MGRPVFGKGIIRYFLFLGKLVLGGIRPVLPAAGEGLKKIGSEQIGIIGTYFALCTG